ncbi:tetratricopeptide repeat protein 33 [Macadamia integrifolia]|uniref:tetratricopeptide repeat protein 33-like n=1 Tax=Macadamia integrifolia TaxID=60698 RepID=UPI001C4FBEC8|nr:tetratricopeptide repeat protein 33-like [Macadamia integrifolia]XP_042518881.1 tetratricopeptide repeat protein 33 [Macadamia integrifolia]
MKITWNKKSGNKRPHPTISHYPNLPFDPEEGQTNVRNEADNGPQNHRTDRENLASEPINTELKLAESFQSEGNKLAEEGRFHEALGKWEAALTLMPGRAVLHEQKAQVLLEVGDAWSALKAATRATELEPSWAEAWITLGRAQLNFGEPDTAIESFDRALAIKPDSEEAKDDRKTASHLVKRRKQLHLSGLSSNSNRYTIENNDEKS